MSIISNISILQNPEAKKAFSKLSFEAGERFNAKIVSSGQQDGEVNLKLLDGWQFPAKLDKALDQTMDGSVLKFEVEGFEDGKLKIKLVNGDKDGKIVENDILETTPNGKPLSDNKTDALIFEKMIKHDIPLTKENVSDIKNLIDFREKISLNPSKEDIFIDKYLNSRNIDVNSEKAIEITKQLKNFFNALKNLDIDEILLFKENNIELTKGNFESFIKLFKGESAVYNNLKDINDYLLNSDTTKNTIKNIETPSIKQYQNSSELKGFQEDDFINFKFTNNNKEMKPDKIFNNNEQIVDKTKNSNNPVDIKNSKQIITLINEELKSLNINNKILNIDNKVLNSIINNLKWDENINSNDNFKLQNGSSFNNDTIKTLVDKIIKTEQIVLSPENHLKLIGNLEEKLNINQNASTSKNLETINSKENIPQNKLQKETVSEIGLDNKNAINTKVNGYGKNNSLNEIINMIKKELNISSTDSIINNPKIDIQNSNTDTLIKEQIKIKTDEIKNIVKLIIENKLNLKPETYEKVMQVFDQKLNDIKIFNSISEQYYYLDLPINVKENEYQLKLIIKDDRKKGKKIDSKNVQIATSVKTINMGTVDAYIKINNNNMNIDIKCNEFFVKVLDLSKEKLNKELSNLNYKVSIKVNNKTNEFTLANCGKFFDDRSFNKINIKV
ncbi:MAG TPA: hypothetical protein VIM70_17395 [Clostridium sp.]|uniref:hypothetical protein n=1 Tax=Clostridium sp. TaxID=1506 RepID=UPI002F935BE0